MFNDDDDYDLGDFFFFLWITDTDGSRKFSWIGFLITLIIAAAIFGLVYVLY